MQSTGVITGIECHIEYKHVWKEGEWIKALCSSDMWIFIDLDDVSSPDVCTPSKICVVLPDAIEQYSPHMSNHPKEEELHVGDHVSVEFQLWLTKNGRFISPDVYNVSVWTLLLLK